MKPVKSLFFSFGIKRGSIVILLVAAFILPVFGSQGQSMARQSNKYSKTRVKQNSINVIILVAENMTDRLSNTKVTPVISKKSNPKALAQPVHFPYLVMCKVKCQPVTKVLKRS